MRSLCGWKSVFRSVLYCNRWSTAAREHKTSTKPTPTRQQGSRNVSTRSRTVQERSYKVIQSSGASFQLLGDVHLPGLWGDRISRPVSWERLVGYSSTEWPRAICEPRIEKVPFRAGVALLQMSTRSRSRSLGWGVHLFGLRFGSK